MSKDKLTDYDSSASNNSDVGGVNTAEGMLPSKVNDAIRELMSHLADFSAGTTGVDVLNLQDDDNSASIKIQAPSELTTTTTFTLPDGDGASGQALLTDGAGALAWQSPASPNLIINGAMNVDQRNETVADGDKTAADDKFTADRFMNQFQDGTSSTRIDSSNATITDHPLGFSNASKIVCSTVDDLADATSVYMNISYRGIEHQDLQRFQFGTSSAKNLTLSFWVKSGVTGTFFATLLQDINTAGNKVRYHASYTISSANTWEKKTISVAGAGTGLNWLSNNTSTQALQIMFHLATSSDRLDSTLNEWFEDTTNTETIRAGTGQTNFFLTADAEFYLTGVQLEEGSVANSVFQYESYGETLQKCQRYFYRIGGNETDALGGNVGRMASGVMFSASTGQLIRPNPVTMRDAPDVTFDDAVANYTVMTSRTTNAVTAVGTNTSTISTMSISLTCGATSGDGDGAVLRSTRAQSTVSISAEL